MPILVTTPTGQVGAEVTRALLSLGATVRLAARHPAKATRMFPGVEVVQFDFDQPATFVPAIANTEVLYLASPREEYPDEPLIQLARTAQQHGVKRVVLLSAMGVENLGPAARALEVYLENSGLGTTFLRPNWFMQNYATLFARQIQHEGRFYEPADDLATAFVDVRDIAGVAARALIHSQHAGRTYTLTGPAALTRHEVATTISAVVEHDVSYVPLSLADFAQQLRHANTPPPVVERLTSFYRMLQEGYSARVTDDIMQVTGQAARTFAQFALDYHTAWQTDQTT